VLLTDKEKDDLLKEILGRDYDTAGQNLPVLAKVIGFVGNSNDLFVLAELVPKINAVLSSSRFISVVASGASIFSIVMFPVSIIISIINAYKTGLRMYSYRAIAYTITAWAYDKPVPLLSRRIIYNARHSAPVQPVSEIKVMHDVWKKTSQSVISEINNLILVNNISKYTFKIFLRAISDNKEQKLCELIMMGYDQVITSFHVKQVWQSNYRLIKYPQ
jgi:Mg2+/Co2+ transporter CorB